MFTSVPLKATYTKYILKATVGLTPNVHCVGRTVAFDELYELPVKIYVYKVDSGIRIFYVKPLISEAAVLSDDHIRYSETISEF